MSSTFAFRRPAPPKTAKWYFEQRRLRRDQRRGYDGWPLRVEQIADRDNLYRCFLRVQKEGGPAAGVDGLHAADLSPSEAGNYLGVLSGCILDGTYRPQRVRPVPIPKPGTTEHRLLKIGVVGDRVVGTALHDAWTPFWESTFLNCSYGFRPKRSTWMLLADLELRMRRLDRYVLAVADIRKAFDFVPIEEVIELHRKALAGVEQNNFTSADKQRTIDLIQKVLRGHNHNRTRGIDQGGPYSPTALNVLLHDMLDVPISEHVDNEPLWFRYADNLLYLSQSVTEGWQVLDKASQLLQPLGLSLKAGAEVVDLQAGGKAQLLGFDLRLEGDRLQYGIGPAAWDNLQQRLHEAHSACNPPIAARQLALGWANSLGPALERGDVASLLSAMAACGYREITPGEVQQQWLDSWKRWQGVRERARRRNHGPGG